MKLFICITAFDGLELLEACVTNYRRFCDNIIICYQDVSHTGNHDSTVYDTIRKYSNVGTIIKYETDLSIGIKENEMAKHSLMVNEAKRQGATHFIMSAVDHFYESDQVKKLLYKASEYDVTFTKIHTYYKNPSWRITPGVPWLMPFICKMYPETEIRQVQKFPVLVDAACKISTCRTFHVFDEKEIMLHNFSNVRINFEEKLKNNSFPLAWGTKMKKKIVDQFNNYDPSSKEPILYYKRNNNEQVTVDIVENIFNL